MQTVVDIGMTLPYQSIGALLGIGYDENGSYVTQWSAYDDENNFDWESIAPNILGMFWPDVTVPSSIFGGLASSPLAAFTQKGAFDLAGSLANVGPADDVVDSFATSTNSWDNGYGIFDDGLPVIPAVPNISSMVQLLMDFSNIAALGEGGTADNLKKFFLDLKPMQDNGDIIISVGTSNLQFGGHGDDIIASVGTLGKLLDGEGDDMLFSAGQYSYLTGNAGNDTMIAIGQYNVIHDTDGNNSIIAFGNTNDTRTGDGNDFLITYGDQTKVRLGGGFNFGIVFGNKNNILLSGDNIICAVGGENNYYITGGEGNKSLIYNLGTAKVTMSGSPKALVKTLGGQIDGAAGDDYLEFGRESLGGMLNGDNRNDYDGRSNDTIVMRDLEADRRAHPVRSGALPLSAAPERCVERYRSRNSGWAIPAFSFWMRRPARWTTNPSASSSRT
ncbi:hypothetical protein [Breoghania sp.]|uniref:hypothetical protein n=1 Tax=Breoghania sp. TaxID=2065378 RepID=UPI0026186A63|nr:hypothetical protein [Breoghania sp.]MDJ0933437.1 hypothetical protein [Breoghania sp.]